MRLETKRLCRKITKLIEKTTSLRDDLVMVNCCYFEKEPVGYKGKRKIHFKFHIRAIDSSKHEILLDKVAGEISEINLKLLPYLVANEWYYKTGRALYRLQDVFIEERKK